MININMWINRYEMPRLTLDVFLSSLPGSRFECGLGEEAIWQETLSVGGTRRGGAVRLHLAGGLRVANVRVGFAGHDQAV